MVASSVVLVLETRNAVVKSDFAGQATLGEQLQGPVDGRKTDLGIPFSNKLIQLVGGEVFPGLEEGQQDRVTLLGVLEADFLQMAMEDLLRVAQRLTGNRRMIVNSFLQHSILASLCIYVNCPDAPKTSGNLYVTCPGCDSGS